MTDYRIIAPEAVGKFVDDEFEGFLLDAAGAVTEIPVSDVVRREGETLVDQIMRAFVGRADWHDFLRGGGAR